MSDSLAEQILQSLSSCDGGNSLRSSDLAAKFGTENQKVVGAIKSLESLGGERKEKEEN